MGRIVRIVMLAASIVGDKATFGETVIFESGELGSTGISFQDAVDGIYKGSSVDTNVYSGVKFEVGRPVTTSQIGGHFFSSAGGSFFGAVVTLDSKQDFPDSGDFSATDVLGTAVLTFPIDSQEVFGDVSLDLGPGWYALVFGSGYFGTDGVGGMVLNNENIGDPTYLAWQRNFGAQWVDISEAFSNFRFVVTGEILPEPRTLVLTSFTCFCVLHRAQRK